MKSILLLLHDDEGQAARVSAALALAHALDGELSCLDVVEVPHLVGDYFSEAGRAMLLGDEERRESFNRDRVTEQLDREGVRYRWTDTRGDADACVAAAADLADIIVLTRENPNPLGFNFRPIVLRAALKGKPILSLPEDALDFRATGRALVAWDGSEGATNMLRACVPLLQKASAVELFTVDYRGYEISADEAAEYLSRHGIHVTVSKQKGGDHNFDEWLRIRCATWRADYCVMGAFGDSHLRHYLFGSTTRRMLALGDLPIILGR